MIDATLFLIGSGVLLCFFAGWFAAAAYRRDLGPVCLALWGGFVFFPVLLVAASLVNILWAALSK